MTSRLSEIFSEPPDALLLAGTAAAAVSAALAPAGLTGSGPIDAIERALIAATCTFVGAHGRRWAWIVAAGLIAVPARGTSMVITLASLVILVSATAPRRRSKGAGALGLGILSSAPFWYGRTTASFAFVFVLAAVALLVGSGLPFLRSSRRGVAKVVLALVAGVVALAVVGTGAAMLLARSHVTDGAAAAQDALDAARNGNEPAARADLAQAQEDFTDAHRTVDSLATVLARVVPGLAQQVHAVHVAVREGGAISGSASDLLATAKYDRLTYRGRLDLTQVRALQGPTRRTRAQLRQSAANLEAVRHGWLVPALDHRLSRFAGQLASARTDATLADEVLGVTPGLFGGDGARHYLVVFITPAELRGAGGFIGSYAELSAVDGRARLTRSGRIMDLISAVPKGQRAITGPADYLHRYGRYDPQDFLQDVTFSPDFPSDASVLAQLYPQSGGRPVDGVISVDPTGMAALLRLTGPVVVPGLDHPLNAGNAVDELTRRQYIDFPNESERGDFLTAATRLTFTKLTQGSLPAPRRIADTLSPAARGGHLRMWSPRQAEEDLFTRLGADGSLAIPSGQDGFSLIQQNVGNNKLDAYLHRTVDYRATVDARTGELHATARIVLSNLAPNLALPAGVVGNSRGAPVGTNLATVSFYSRSTVSKATIDGAPVLLGPDRELGLNVYDTPILRIPPGGSITITLQLDGGVDLGDGYRFEVVPQPVANPDVVAVTVTIVHGRGGPRVTTILHRGAVVRPTSLVVGIA